MRRWLAVLRPDAGRRLLLAILLLVAFGAAVAAVTPLDVETRILAAVSLRTSSPLSTAVRVVSAIGDLWVMFLVVAVWAWAVRGSAASSRLQVLIVLTLGGSLLVTSILKVLTARPRPEEPLVSTITLAYPSGHAVRAAAVYGLAAWAVQRYVRRRLLRYTAVLTTLVLIVAIAGSRMSLRVHWPSDVIAGLLIGGIWLLVSLHVVRPPPSDDRADLA